MPDNTIPVMLYGHSDTSMYIDALSPEENPWANYRNYGEGGEGLNPTAATGADSVMVSFFYPLSTWGASKMNMASWMARRHRRMWVMLSENEYADAKRLVQYWENESGVADLVCGYLTTDEPDMSRIELTRGQIRAVREASDKPIWTNVQAGNWQTVWPAVFGIGGSRHEYYPNIFSFTCYPWTFSDDVAGDRYINRIKGGVTHIPEDTGQEAGYDFYVSKFIKLYMTTPLSVGCELTPDKGHVLGMIIQGQEQKARIRSDRNTSAFQTYSALTSAKVLDVTKMALAQSPYNVAVGESSTYAPTKQVGGTQLLQAVSYYWWGGNGHGLTEAEWDATGQKEMPLVSSSRLRGYVSSAITTLRSWSIPGTIVFPSPAAEPALTGQCAPPRITPGTGVFYRDTSKTVTMTCATAGASIYYTTDGSVPTGSSTLYSDPISVSVSTTIRAVAIKGGLSDSPIHTVRLTFASVAVSYNLTDVKYYAVTGLEARLNGAKIQASDDGTTWTDVYTISGTPSAGYTTQAVTVAQRWRYYRLYHASAKVVVGDLQWLNQGERLQGTIIDGGASAGHDATQGYDGDLTTYFEASGNEGYLGLDCGSLTAPPPPPPPLAAALTPASVVVMVGKSSGVTVANLGTRTYTLSVADATVASTPTVGLSAFVVKGLKAGRTTITITLSDATELTLGVDVQMISPSNGEWRSVPRAL